MARAPKRWSERSARSQRRILNQFRAAGLSNRQIREGVNRGSLRPYARDPQNRASARMRQAHPYIARALSGDKYGGYGSRDELYTAARTIWVTSWPTGDGSTLTGWNSRGKPWPNEAGQMTPAVAILGMNADRIARLAEAGNSPDELAKRLGAELPRSGIIGWYDPPDSRNDDDYHNPFWYH